MNNYTSISESINDNNDNDDNYNPFEETKKFIEKENKLMQNRKEQLEKDLNKITAKLREEKNIDTFIYNNIDNILGISEIIKNYIDTFCSFIVIKIIGTIFMTLYFIGILEIIGLLNTIQKEILSSFNLTLREIKRETDFYQNYINENLKMPSFDLFFLSAIFSNCLTNLITFPGTVILVLIINSCIIYFGFGYFDFHTGEYLNEKYTFKENIYLIGLYFLIYLFLGIIALFPHEIIEKGFILFDLQKSNIIKKNGYILVYLFSMVVSSIIKNVLDRKFVFDKIRLIINNKEDDSFFSYTSVIILIYTSSMISSLIFYWIYECIFIQGEKRERNTAHEAIKIFGYIIYKEKASGDCCLDCSVMNYKCGMCLGMHLCNCCSCCCCLDYNEASEGTRQLCIIYKIKGICSWILDLLTALDMFKLVIAISIFGLINIGFNPVYSEYISNISEKKILILNIISFSSIILFYLANILIGYLYMNCCRLGKDAIELHEKGLSKKIEKAEINYIMQPIIIFTTITVGLSTILSCLYYFKVLQNIIYYFIPFSLSLEEYANIIIIYYAENIEISIDIIKKSFAISFYKQLLYYFIWIINIFLVENKSLILTQFIFGCIISGLLSFYLILTSILNYC